MNRPKLDTIDLEKAQSYANDVLQLFKAWVPKRKDTVEQVRLIADEMDNVNENVNFARLAGTGTSVVGGIATVAAIGGTFPTGGLAAPLIGVGIACSADGAVTSTSADVIGKLVSKKKMDHAQKILNYEAELSSEIEQKKAKLDKLVDRLSYTSGIDRDSVMGILFLANFISRFSPTRLSSNMAADTSLLFLSYGLILSRRTFDAVGKGVTKPMLNISLKGLTKVVGSVLKGVALGAAGIVLAWDVYQLVRTTVDLAEGSKSSAADSLRNIATELGNQMREIEEWLNTLPAQATGYETQINKQFLRLLKRVSNSGYATDAENEEILKYVEYFADPEWKSALQPNFDYVGYTFHLARVLDILYKRVQAYQKKDGDKKKHIDITIIGHGSIDPLKQQIASYFYYLSPDLKSVTLYEPWGCAIDATVVYGITTNTIQIGFVQYSGEVRPSEPSDWNCLPRTWIGTPNTILNPVTVDEPAYKELKALFAMLQVQSDGLVIPYFNGLGFNLLPFPDIPLWALCNALSLIGAILNATVSIRIAACLSVDNPSLVTGHVPCDQYCTVDGSAIPPVMMTSNLGLPAGFCTGLDKLNGFL